MIINAILVIAYRDVLKFLRDRGRIVASLIFPVFFIGILGGSLQANLGKHLGYDYVTFIFTGVFAQTLFQSSALGIVSLLEDRENDFTQEIFVSPVSRYAIVFGKIVGETLVSLLQGLAVIFFGLLIRVQLTPAQIPGLIVTGIAVCLLGGAFGVLVLANVKSQRTANQIFPFIFFPQFFLAGLFSPIAVLPWYLDIPSKLSPLRYGVDLTRSVYYVGLRYHNKPEYASVVLTNPLFNMVIIAAIFVVCLVSGTLLFVNSERNR